MSNEFEPACRRMEWLDPFYKSVWEKAFADAIPISGTFELTPRCNFNCRMCYVHLKEEQIPQYGKELTAKEWIHIAEEAKEAGTTWLCITGGEPLMHPEFETIWKELSQMGFFMTLQTNASLIQGKMADLLERYPPRSVKVTLYGTDDNIYRDVCQVENGYTRVNAGIQRLKQMKIPVELVSTVIRQNQDDVVKMAFYAYINKLRWAATGNIRKSVRGADTDVESLRVVEGSKVPNGTKIVHDEKKKAVIDYERKPCTYCRDYRVGYWVLWNGKMSFCGFIDEIDISLNNLPFSQAWKKLIEIEDMLEWPVKCKTCVEKNKCLKCAATLATECGSIHEVKDEFCNNIKKSNI